MRNDPNRCIAKSKAAKLLWRNKNYRFKQTLARKNRYKRYRKSKGYRKWYNNYYIRLKKRLVEAYGGRCRCCGESTLEFLTIDHTNKRIRKFHKRMASVGSRFYKWLEKNNFPKYGIRLLCMNCNLATSWGRTCPHKRNKIVRSK